MTEFLKKIILGAAVIVVSIIILGLFFLVIAKCFVVFIILAVIFACYLIGDCMLGRPPTSKDPGPDSS